jgi:hypothetical protein
MQLDRSSKMDANTAELRRLRAMVSAQDVVLQAFLSSISDEAFEGIRSRAMTIADGLGHPDNDSFVIFTELERMETLRQTGLLLERAQQAKVSS